MRSTNTLPSLDYLENSRQYYGEIISQSTDLQTTACCPSGSLPSWLRPIYAKLPPEIIERSYGCGSPLPLKLDGCTVLDLGCGTGRDLYAAAHLVGPSGRLIGIDFTEEQIEVARKYRRKVAEEAGLEEDKIQLVQGNLENLAEAGVPDGSIQVAISNCVLNLCRDKKAALKAIFAALEEGGELYFSDVFASRRLCPEITNHPVLHGECLGGAWYWEDFRRLLLEVGCPDFRIMERGPIQIHNRDLASLLEGTSFEAATLRCFKLGSLEDRCEDYGQVATYLGCIPAAERIFHLDHSHTFEIGRPTAVCGNTASLLSETRFAPHFKINGDRSTHYGLFQTIKPSTQSQKTIGCC
ncbi:MAG: methyltransferase domain-containing protein [Puniceicoccaceae bacterium]